MISTKVNGENEGMRMNWRSDARGRQLLAVGERIRDFVSGQHFHPAGPVAELCWVGSCPEADKPATNKKCHRLSSKDSDRLRGQVSSFVLVVLNGPVGVDGTSHGVGLGKQLLLSRARLVVHPFEVVRHAIGADGKYRARASS